MGAPRCELRAEGEERGTEPSRRARARERARTARSSSMAARRASSTSDVLRRRTLLRPEDARRVAEARPHVGQRNARTPGVTRRTSRSPLPPSTVAVPPSATTSECGRLGQRREDELAEAATRRTKRIELVGRRAAAARSRRRPRRRLSRREARASRARAGLPRGSGHLGLVPVAAEASRSTSAVPSPPSATGSSSASAPASRTPRASAAAALGRGEDAFEASG